MPHTGTPQDVRNPRPKEEPVIDYFALSVPDTHTLNGTTIRALESEDGERLYLIRVMDLDGKVTNYVTTQGGIEHLRQEVERAMLSGMFG
ncbi:hypothetical protein ACFWE3_16935 [Mycobacteriaceae bacterium NPDC060252]